jgi:hypothetical protein
MKTNTPNPRKVVLFVGGVELQNIGNEMRRMFPELEIDGMRGSFALDTVKRLGTSVAAIVTTLRHQMPTGLRGDEDRDTPNAGAYLTQRFLQLSSTAHVFFVGGAGQKLVEPNNRITFLSEYAWSEPDELIAKVAGAVLP